MSFSLDKQKVKLVHMNLREEKHGPDETALAVDLSFRADVSNDFLSELAPTLKWSLYDKPETPDLAGGGEGYSPVLRYSQLGALDWRCDMVDATVVLHGSSKAKSLEFTAKVNKLTLECKDGGTVAIGFRVQTPVLPDQAGALSAFLSRESKISIAPAEVLQPIGDA